MAVDEYGLTPRQRAWADAYIEKGSATEAARIAGYKIPHISGHENISKPYVKKYLAMRMQPTVARRIADADEVMDFLSRTMRGEIRDQFGLDASLADRIKAAQELAKRYAVADQRQAGTMQRLDMIFATVKGAIGGADAQIGAASVIATTMGDAGEDAPEDG